MMLSPSERVSGPGRSDHWLREAILGVGVQLSWRVWWSGYWAQALGPLGRTGSRFIRAAELLSDPLALLSTWVELRVAGCSVSVAGRGRGEGRGGAAGSSPEKEPLSPFCFPYPLQSPTFVSPGPQLAARASSSTINMIFITPTVSLWAPGSLWSQHSGTPVVQTH